MVVERGRRERRSGEDGQSGRCVDERRGEKRRCVPSCLDGSVFACI